MRELGEGMKRMFALMEESELDKPTLQSEGTSFSVTLPHKSVFTSKQEQWLLMFQQFNLSTLQKKIVVLGMEGREIAPAEIYKAINTPDRNTYDREVTALRKKHLLVEIRTNPQATGIARRNIVSKAEVPRFKVQTPGVSAVPEPQRRTRLEPRPRASTPSVIELPPRRYEISSHAVFFMPVGDETTEVEIREMFAGAGTVLDVRLPVDRTTGIRRGFGFVYFGTAEVQIAVRTLNGSMLRGRRLRVDERRT